MKDIILDLSESGTINEQMILNIQENNIGNNEKEKHTKYEVKYKPNSLYWGLGIENELYLEFEKKINIDKTFFLKNHKRERYSVDYFSNYNNKYLNDVFNYYVENYTSNNISLPLLLNSHSFLHTDCKNNSKKLYTKKAEPNPEFNGKILLEELLENNYYLKNNIGHTWLFDGDIIEITSNDFFNAKLENVLNEIKLYKKNFIENINNTMQKLNIYSQYGKLKFMECNHPFGIYLTNLNNISMFNNGTLHFNLTLPTELDEKNKIKNINKFKNDHSKAIKIIQWMEPFIIAIYGEADIFSKIDGFKNSSKFSNSSQRCAISRYIGLGTYDSDKLESGKILTKDIKDLDFSSLDYWWYNKYYEDNAYTKLNELGLDINFNKHYNHGIEIRFIDHINDQQIFSLFEFIIYLMDYLLESENKINEFGNPIKNKIWNEFVVNIFKYGHKYILNTEERELYQKIFNIEFKKYSVYDIYNEIYFYLIIKFNNFFKSIKNNVEKSVLIPNGKFSSLTLDVQYIDSNLLENYSEMIKQFTEINEDNDHNKNNFIEKVENILNNKINEYNSLSESLNNNNNDSNNNVISLDFKNCCSIC
jgi:hypothetical protein